MPAFRFKLEFLLSLRKKREEEAALKLAKRLASVRELENKLSAIADSRQKLSEDVSLRSREGTLTPPLIALYGEYQAKLLQDAKKAQELLNLSLREKAKEQAALQKAAMERQLMEKIKEKKAVAHKTAELYQEQIILEEMASLVRDRKFRNA
ncbi:MAG: flagellar export protein FliJ [Deltaproteobacteria bacterium]|jgi:flagellar FliJ protein|nr:flagellar export protein FliJ [Deltaproteobacteria bacterium]